MLDNLFNDVEEQAKLRNDEVVIRAITEKKQIDATCYGGIHYYHVTLECKEDLEKFYKFQFQCTHPSAYWYEDEKICERCAACIERKNKDLPELNTWEGEGGRVI